MKYALVTGGSRGIGRAVCIQLAQDSEYHILINYNSNKTAAEEVKVAVEAHGKTATLLPFDVTDATAVQTSLDTWQDENKDAIIEVIVNNAGITKDGMFMWMPQEDWHTVINTSLNGFFNVTNHLVQ